MAMTGGSSDHAVFASDAAGRQRKRDCRDDEQCQNDDGDDLGQDRFGFGCFGSHEAHSFNKNAS